LAFDARRHDEPESLHDVFGVGVIPSDTHMRTTVDEVLPTYIRRSVASFTRCNGAKHCPK
jgi:hypothetical protein